MQFHIRAFFIIAFLVLLSLTLWVSPSPIHAKEIREDTDNDGQTDRIVHLAPSGDVVKLEADTNGDLKLDTFQYYQGGVIERIERDTDADGRIDERDILENEKPVARQMLNIKGEIISILSFDGERRPLEWRRDTTGDGRLDTAHKYQGGKLQLVTRDTTGDGRVNVWQRFRNEKPYEQTADLNGDDQIDQAIRYDDQGRPLSVREFAANPNQPIKISRFKEGELCSVEQIDSGRVVFTRFQSGEPVKQTIDTDRDGRPEQTITYDNQGNVDSAFSDTNHDGRIDAWQYYRRGALHRTEQDRNHDGEVDAKSEYEDGRQIRLILDSDGDGHFETRTGFVTAPWTRVTELVDKAGRRCQRLFYSGEVLRKIELFEADTGRLANIEEFDPAGNIVMSREAEGRTGALNLTWRFDSAENAVAAETDSDGDGVVDIWYHYENGRVTRVAEDRNKDGKPDLWETYDAAQVVVCQSEDLDFDGTADIERRY